MNSQSKIIVSVIAGLALGAALAAVLYYLKEDQGGHLQSGGIANDGPSIADDWSDMNDSLGG